MIKGWKNNPLWRKLREEEMQRRNERREEKELLLAQAQMQDYRNHVDAMRKASQIRQQDYNGQQWNGGLVWQD